MNLTVEWVDQNDVYESDVYSERTPKLLQPMIPVIRVAALRRLLLDAQDKLKRYRGQHSGEYVGGVEYTHLDKQLTDLLAQLPEKGI